jgi:indole-3-glycerol phosphate synthase
VKQILDRIIVNKRAELEDQKTALPLADLKQRVEPGENFPFQEALKRKDRINIIAELKKSSPSRGTLAEEFDPKKLAELYSDGGAAALSVLTERAFFHGQQEYINLARSESGLPVLCKDFIVDPYQVYFARYMNADAILLIVRLHTRRSLTDFMKLATDLGLDCLVEVHDEQELNIALDSGAQIIGINNRDLSDFSVNLEISERLGELIPDPVVKICESGIFTKADITHMQKAGFNCFLIGEALVKADDPVRLLQSLIA